MIYSSRTEDEASVFAVCRNCVHLFQNMQVIIDFFKSWASCFTLYYKFISVFNTMTCPGSPARPWISPLHCFWHCRCHWKMCQLRGRHTQKKKEKETAYNWRFPGQSYKPDKCYQCYQVSKCSFIILHSIFINHILPKSKSCAGPILFQFCIAQSWYYRNITMLPSFILTNPSGICWPHLYVSTDYMTTIRDVCITWIHFLCTLASLLNHRWT